MSLKWKIALWIIIWVIILIVGNWMHITQHEKAHAQVCKQFGGNVTSFNIRITETGFDGNVTCDYGFTNTPEYKLAQSNAEIVGYHQWADSNYMALLVFISVMMIIMVTHNFEEGKG